MPVAAIQVGSSIASGVLGSNAANAAAKAQQQATAKNLAFNNQVLGQVGSDVNPTIGYGNAAGGELAGLLGTGGNPQASQNAFNNYLNSTNYKFQLGQGLQGVGYLNAPNLFSGATGKALNNYAQGMAGNALYGYEGLLQGQQGLGLEGSNIYANAGTNIAGLNQQANNLAAGAQAGAAFGSANSWTNALSRLTGSLGNAFGSSSFGNPFGGGSGGTSIGGFGSIDDLIGVPGG